MSEQGEAVGEDGQSLNVSLGSKLHNPFDYLPWFVVPMRVDAQGRGPAGEAKAVETLYQVWDGCNCTVHQFRDELTAVYFCEVANGLPARNTTLREQLTKLRNQNNDYSTRLALSQWEVKSQKEAIRELILESASENKSALVEYLRYQNATQSERITQLETALKLSLRVAQFPGQHYLHSLECERQHLHNENTKLRSALADLVQDLEERAEHARDGCKEVACGVGVYHRAKEVLTKTEVTG